MPYLTMKLHWGGFRVHVGIDDHICPCADLCGYMDMFRDPHRTEIGPQEAMDMCSI